MSYITLYLKCPHYSAPLHKTTNKITKMIYALQYTMKIPREVIQNIVVYSDEQKLTKKLPTKSLTKVFS